MRQFKVNYTLNFRLVLFLLMLSFSIPTYARDYDIFSFNVNYCTWYYDIDFDIDIHDSFKDDELIINLDTGEMGVASFVIKEGRFYINGVNNNNEPNNFKEISFSVKNNKQGIMSIKFFDDSVLSVSEFDVLGALFFDNNPYYRARKIYLYYEDGSEREYVLKYNGSDDQAINKKWDKLWISLIKYKLQQDYGENFNVSKEHDVLLGTTTYIIYDKTTEKYGACDQNGKLIIPIEFDFISFNNDHFCVNKKNKKQKAIFDKNGKAITPFISCDNLYIMWTFLKDHSLFFAIEIVKSGKSGVLDYNGNLIIPIEYEHVIIERVGDKLYYSVTKGKNKYGAYSLSGELLVQPKYFFLQYEDDNFVYFDKNYNKYNTGIKLP